MRTCCRSSSFASLYFACAATFIVLGMRQAFFTGIGIAFLGLALASFNGRDTP